MAADAAALCLRRDMCCLSSSFSSCFQSQFRAQFCQGDVRRLVNALTYVLFVLVVQQLLSTPLRRAKRHAAGFPLAFRHMVDSILVHAEYFCDLLGVMCFS